MVAEALDTVRAGLAALREGLCDATAQETVEAAQQVLDEATVLRLDAIRLLDVRRRSGSTVRERDTAAGLAEQLGIGQAEARRAVRSARNLDELPVLAAAVAAGEVSPSTADAIVGAARAPGDLTVLRAAEEELVALARRAGPDEVARRARWVVAAGPDRLAKDRIRQQADRGLRLHTRRDGMVALQGALLPEVGELWRTILDASVKATYRRPDQADQDEAGAGDGDRRSGHDGAGDGCRAGDDGAGDAGAGDGCRAGDVPVAEDRRSAAQRMHDAFAGLGGRLLEEGLTPRVHGGPARVLVAIDLASFDPSRHDPQLLDALGLDVDRIRAAASSVLPAGVGLLPETGSLLPAELVQRLAGEERSELVPLLFDGFTPLARGRTRRYADHHLRLGLVVRDQGCVDCGAPPSWCDADHDPDWEQDGRTDPDGMVLRCRACHVERHRRNRTTRAAPSVRGATTIPTLDVRATSVAPVVAGSANVRSDSVPCVGARVASVRIGGARVIGARATAAHVNGARSSGACASGAGTGGGGTARSSKRPAGRPPDPRARGP